MSRHQMWVALTFVTTINDLRNICQSFNWGCNWTGARRTDLRRRLSQIVAEIPGQIRGIEPVHL